MLTVVVGLNVSKNSLTGLLPGSEVIPMDDFFFMLAKKLSLQA